MTKRELATVLAALRNWQGMGMPELYTDPAQVAAHGEYAEYFHDQDPLSSEEIDHLCERLNFGEAEG